MPFSRHLLASAAFLSMTAETGMDLFTSLAARTVVVHVQAPAYDPSLPALN